MVPLSPEIDAMRRQASVLRGPDAPGPELAVSRHPGPTARELSGLGRLDRRVRPSPLERSGPPDAAGAYGDGDRCGGRCRGAIKAVNPEPINFLFNKKAADMVRVGRRGGIASRLSRAAKTAEERALSDAIYRGHEPGPIETIHEANQKLDELFPWLAGAEKDVNRAPQRAGAVGGARPKRLVDGYLRWAVDPKTGKVHLGPFVPSGQDDPVGFETHADWFDRIGLPIAGRKFDSIPKGYAQIDKRGEMHILDNGAEVEEGLRSRPLSNQQYKLLEERLLKHLRIPSYDTGGSVASIGLAEVHAGEAIIPGQKMPLSAMTPYAGSLVEQGGSLYQQASFQNNAWHMYGSNLPTLGGVNPPFCDTQKLYRAESTDALNRLLSLKRPARSLRELRPLDRPIVIMVLKLRVFAQLRERSAERGPHHAARGCGWKVAGHFVRLSPIRSRLRPAGRSEVITIPRALRGANGGVPLRVGQGYRADERAGLGAVEVA